jgi:hypothetical protein
MAMHQVAMYQPTISEWTFTPSWKNPRVRRFVAAMVARQFITTCVLFLIYQKLFGYASLHAFILAAIFAVVVYSSSFAFASPTNRQLVINPFGLAYRSSGANAVHAVWADVESIGRYRWFWLPAEDGIFLSKRAPVSNAFVKIYGKWGRFVPLTLFDPDWRTGEIGALLRYYNPALFGSNPDQ